MIPTGNLPLWRVLAYHRQVAVEDIRKATWAALDQQFDDAGRAAIRPKIDAIQGAMVDVGKGDHYRLDWQSEERRLVLYLKGAPRFESDDADLSASGWANRPCPTSCRQALLSQRD